MITTIIFLHLLVLIDLASANNQAPEKFLIKKLMADYAKWGKFGRPVISPNQSISVEFSLELHSIIEVDDGAQPAVTIFCWLSQRWTDPLLSWEPSEHAGIEEIVLPVKDIWSPDTTLYNGLFTNDLTGDSKMAVVQANGAVAWILPRTFKVLCERLDQGAYPYDGIKCFFKLGSWTTSGAKIRYSFASEDNDFSMATFIPHPQWRVSSHFASRNELYYACCPDTPFIDLSYHLKIRRIRFSSHLLHIFPLIALGSLTAVPFLMPSKTAAKVQTACMTFAGLFLYGVILAFVTPSHLRNTGNVACFQVELVNAGLAILLASWFSEMRAFTHQAPRCLASFCHALAVIVLCRCCCCCCVSSSSKRSSNSPPPTTNSSNLTTANSCTAIASSNVPMIIKNGGVLKSNDEHDLDVALLNKKRRTCNAEWRTIADVFNVLTAFCILVVTALLLAVTFPRPLDNTLY